MKKPIKKNENDFDLGESADFDSDANFNLADVPSDVMDNLEATGDLEKDKSAEVSALLQGFKDRNDRENTQKADALDSEYYFCVCFQTRDQKEAFLEAVGWLEHGDKYLDGKFVAKKLGVKLPDAKIRFHEREEKSSFTNEIKTIRNLR